MQPEYDENAENRHVGEYDENCKSTPIKAKDNNHHTKDEHATGHEDFNVRVMAETESSVTVNWNLIAGADVYKIEKYHKRRGWEKIAWVSEGPATVNNLEENFTFRLRINALRVDDALRCYVTHAVSSDFMVTTLTGLPTTLSLHNAIKKGQQFLIKRMLRRRPSLLDYPGPNGYLPLANAISCAPSCIIDVLLSQGANVHIANPLNRHTPLHLAFRHGRLPVARILLNKKAALEAGDINGSTPCHSAVDANQQEILKFALDNGANVEVADDCGWTLLMRAVVMRADLGVLKLLVTHGASATTVDNLGNTCVDLARLYKNEEAQKYFARAFKAQKS